MPIGLITNDDTSRREDILDVIQDVSPAETPLMTLFQTTTAKNTIHQWVEDYQGRATSTSTTTEGKDFTVVDLTQPVKRTNLTAIVTKPVQVSGTERSVNVVGGQDPFDYQKAKGLVGWKLAAEFNLVNGAKISGTSGVASGMAGLLGAISSHLTARTSGTSISVQEINDMVSDVVSDVGIANMFDILLVPFGIKQRLGTLSTNITRYQEAASKMLSFPVQIWESDGGDLKVLPHLDLPKSVGSAAIVGLREDKYRVAYLRTPEFQDMGKGGDHTRGQWVGELTLEALAERSSTVRTGYAANG